jgi:hypothetical protein
MCFSPVIGILYTIYINETAPNLIFSRYRGYSMGVKRPEPAVNHSSPSRAEAEKA